MKILAGLILSLFALNLFSQALTNECVKRQASHIVVLGSSTAAGSGPSSPDSTWVNRYRKYVQSINPQNTVTNLARGGTTTYNIMPDWFVPSAGRPVRDTTRNISQALRLGADAIIVNMPSNDAANGFNAAEQMGNFRLLKRIADSSTIPIWICTTQPRRFSTAQDIIQLNTRDSINAVFGRFAIDFWSGFADKTTYDIRSFFDSGDGVHMNDTAHGILVNRVIGEGILSELADTLSFADHFIASLITPDLSECGDSNAVFKVVVGNYGLTTVDSINLHVTFNDLVRSWIDTVSIIGIDSIKSCSVDTFTFNRNTYSGSSYDIFSYLESSDSILQNDTSELSFYSSLGIPIPVIQNDTICKGGMAALTVNSNSLLDKNLWYSSMSSSNVLHIGDTFTLNAVHNDSSLFVETVRGNLHYDASLLTSRSTNVNYNGLMFNIIATDTITIDSLSLKINSVGQQGVVAYYKFGTYQGFENNSTAWTSWGVDTVLNQVSGNLCMLNFGTINLNAQDTLGVYLHMQNSTSDLSYLRSTSPLVYNDSRLSIPSGSGINNTFGTIFHPRNFSGEVYYHYGFNPSGSCSAGRNEVKAIVSDDSLRLGNDTLLDLRDSLVLTINSQFQNVNWSTGDTVHSLKLDTSLLSVGRNIVWVSALDRYGCMLTDTITVEFTNLVSLEEKAEIDVSIFPNPAKDFIHIQTQHRILKLELFNTEGKFISDLSYSSGLIDLDAVDKGMYFLKVQLTDHPNPIFRKLLIYRD